MAVVRGTDAVVIRPRHAQRHLKEEYVVQVEDNGGLVWRKSSVLGHERLCRGRSTRRRALALRDSKNPNRVTSSMTRTSGGPSSTGAAGEFDDLV
jgi:hypothetical protein